MARSSQLHNRLFLGHTDEQFRTLRDRQLSQVLYWRFFVNLALMLVDAAMFLIAEATVLNVRTAGMQFYSSRLGFAVDTTLYLVVSACCWIWSLRTVGIYHRHIMGDGYQVNILLVKGMALCWMLHCTLDYIFGFRMTLRTLTLMVVAGWLLTAVERIVSRMFLTRSRDAGQFAYGTVIVGSPKGIGNTLRFLGRRQQLNYRPVAVCPIRFNPETGLIEADTDIEMLEWQISANWGDSLPVLEYRDQDLAYRIVDMNAQTVLVADELRRYSDNYNIFSVRMESSGLEIAMLASAADTANHEFQIRSIQGVTIITQRLAQYTPSVRFAKRMFDLVVSSLAIVCSLFITLPVAIAIKLTDGGPVFYTQTRVGLNGKPFEMIKFRSMVTDADKLKAELAKQTGQTDRFIFKMKDDPRITPIGRFIRRFSIDELPQFLNVFKGDMSTVGPRPPLPEEYERYNTLYATRMLVKPGITGPWQVSGRSDLSAEESEALDVAYVQNWSIMGDIHLMFRTVGAVLSHKGAY
ncbi:sugar transferase [Bifidobacterium sp. UTBIF-78]|uniref:sugar transferase n=1 Tax=Bifidobacterium sp. UTBIF-78 TaxID=1465263 RepID=UPI0035BFE484